MTQILRLRITGIWALLVLATCISFESVRGFAWARDPRLATIAVILIAFMKVRYVVLDFMELRHAPMPLRLFFEVWIAALAALLIGTYWVLTPIG